MSQTNSPGRHPSKPWALALAVIALGALTGCADSVGNTAPVILFSPIESTSVFLMGLGGEMLHEWKTDYAPGYSVYLLPDGRLLRATSIPDRPFAALQGSNGGRVEMLDWNGAAVWRFDYATTEGQQHHDVFWMPSNGHVLMLAWERRTAAEALAAGRRPETIPAQGELWVDKVAEVDPATNQIVWEWRTWDHLVPPGESPADHPGLIDPNYNATPDVDWTHANAVFYNAALDQVMVSVRNFSEVWVLDHSTTTAQAAGHAGGRLGRGGDLLYRWGNPRVYGGTAPQQLFGQHNATWIPSGLPGAGHMLVFDNGDSVLRPHSTVVEFVPPVNADGTYAYDPPAGFGPSAPTWQYDPATAFLAPIISGAQRLASGNTLVTDGPAGHFFEVTPDGQTVWTYTLTDTAGGTGHLTFRATRYEPGYSGLMGRDLQPGPQIRLAPVAAESKASIKRY
jgi:hypothetical protein